MFKPDVKPKTLEDISRQQVFLEKKIDLLLQHTWVESKQCTVYDIWKERSKEDTNEEKQSTKE